MHKRLAFLSLIALSLVGCKVEHVSRITDSQLDGSIQTVQATARIEVMACTDYQDKSKPSNSLVEADSLVKKLFSTSEFHGCHNENFKSIATYLVPMDVGSWQSDEEFTPKNITIVKNKHENVFFAIPQNIIDGVKKYEQQPMADDINLNIKIRYVNDSDKDVSLNFLAAYVNNDPLVSGKTTIPPNKNVDFLLSNVSSDQALKRGFAFTFTKEKDTTNQK